MTGKSAFTEDEWHALLESVTMASVAVVAASPSGPIGIVKEMFAAGKMLAHVKAEGTSSELVRAVVDELATSEGRAEAQRALKADVKGAGTEEIKTRALASLREVAGIVDAKATPEDAAAFKAWLGTISQKVAEAAKEGGFLGFGGERVSEAELVALKDIGDALGTPA